MNNTCKIAILSALVILLAGADLAFGSTSISPLELWQALSGTGDPINQEILFNLRLPRMLTAILAGASLSVAGLLMQTLFQNPLAGPFILGVSSGSTLGVAICTMASSIIGIAIGIQWITILAAIIGATAILLMVLGVSRKVRQAVSLLIIGLMVGNIASAIVNIIQNYANPDSLKLFIIWTFGSLSSVGWEQMRILLPVIMIGLLIAILLMKPLNGLLLGENYARGLGIDIYKTRFLIILATGLLAGGITAFTGPIAFVGVAIPHIARGIFQSNNHRITLPGSILCGAVLLLVCDIISQTSTYALPISTVSALFGAPIIIWIILKKK